MIVSHRHRFIFVKTVKTASTSVEIALSRHCGPDDVITPLSERDEALRRAEGGRPPQNHLVPWSEYAPEDVAELATRRHPKAAFFNHIGARAARERLGAEVWESYRKLTVERNPWDKVLSYFHWIQGHDAGRALDELIESGDAFACRGWPLYTVDDVVAVDTVMRFESLEEELGAACAALGIDTLGPLPHEKSHFRRDRRSYREVLTDAQRDTIARACAPEIALMGYRW